MPYIARKFSITRQIRQCGIYATAKNLKARGYTLHQALLIIYSHGGLDKRTPT